MRIDFDEVDGFTTPIYVDPHCPDCKFTMVAVPSDTWVEDPNIVFIGLICPRCKFTASVVVNIRHEVTDFS